MSRAIQRLNQVAGFLAPFSQVRNMSRNMNIPQPIKPSREGTSMATFAAGCFWSVELVFQRKEGVLQTQVGFTGGKTEQPSYRDVCSGSTGHTEAVLLEYDPSIISYETLLEAFWNKHDPTQGDRQGGDIGSQYRSAIFAHSEKQFALAELSKNERQRQYKSPITTEIAMAGLFYPAEEYHQKYLEKGGQCASKGCGDAIKCYG